MYCIVSFYLNSYLIGRNLYIRGKKGWQVRKVIFRWWANQSLRYQWEIRLHRIKLQLGKCSASGEVVQKNEKNNQLPCCWTGIDSVSSWITTDFVYGWPLAFNPVLDGMMILDSVDTVQWTLWILAIFYRIPSAIDHCVPCSTFESPSFDVSYISHSSVFVESLQ